MSILSHNEIEDILINLTFDKVSGVQATRLGEAFASMRALLRQREEETQRQCRAVGYESVALLADAFCDVVNERTDLRDQLAAITAERDESVKIATGLIYWAPITDADVKWAEIALARQKHQGGLP